ncbi:MAG: tRNA 2-thiocytidine biosynthesis protein TtcA [Clostridia bacterium]|nr:tRNA 2-thiocytidine biosynthesis protein TtcA [Clostridia bacterium]
MAERILEKSVEIERSIIKKYRKSIWNPFVGAVKEYGLINEGDKIAVCISGGKDSVLLAKCMEQLCRHSEVPFTLKFITMDPGYKKENREKIENNARLLNIPLEIYDSDIFAVANSAGGSPCYLCARMRRGWLYNKAKELGCNKIALGHHFDDAIETWLLSMLWSGEAKTMLPKLKSDNFPDMELIRPLYKVKEEAIIKWAKSNELSFLNCACRFTEESEEFENLSKRRQTKQLIKELKKTNPKADENLFMSMHNVNLGAIVGWRYRDGEELHSFSEKY